MKQALLLSAAVLAINGQNLRGHTLGEDAPTIPEVPQIKHDPIDFTPVIPEKPDLKDTITLEDLEALDDNELTAVIRLPNGTFYFPDWNRTITPPNFNGTIDPRPTIPEKPIRIPILDYAIAADDELAVTLPKIVRLPNGTFYFPDWNRTIELPPFDPSRPAIPEKPILIDPIRRPITVDPERPFDYAIAADDEFAAVPKIIRLPNGTFYFPEFNRTITPPNFNGTIDPRPTIPEKPIRTPILIDPIRRPITVDPERPFDYAIAADDELALVVPKIVRLPNGTFYFPDWNTTIELPPFDPSIKEILRDPIERPLPEKLIPDDELAAVPKIVRLPNGTFYFPDWNRTITPPNFNGTIDPRPTIPEKPIRVPILPYWNETVIAADEELTAIPERLRPAIPERPIKIPTIIDPRIKPIPIPTIIDPTIKPIPIPTVIPPTFEPIYADAADDELTAIPERLRPVIPERPRIPIRINPRERAIPIPTIIDPRIKPVPIPTIIDPTIKPIPIPTVVPPTFEPIYADAADDELIARPIPIPTVIPRVKAVPIPTIIPKIKPIPIPTVKPRTVKPIYAVADDDELEAIAGF